MRGNAVCPRDSKVRAKLSDASFVFTPVAGIFIVAHDNQLNKLKCLLVNENRHLTNFATHRTVW